MIAFEIITVFIYKNKIKIIIMFYFHRLCFEIFYNVGCVIKSWLRWIIVRLLLANDCTTVTA